MGEYCVAGESRGELYEDARGVYGYCGGDAVQGKLRLLFCLQGVAGIVFVRVY